MDYLLSHGGFVLGEVSWDHPPTLEEIMKWVHEEIMLQSEMLKKVRREA